MTKGQRKAIRKRLFDYGYILDEIKVKEAEIKRLCGGLKTTRYDPSGVMSHSGSSDRIGTAAVRIEELETQLISLREKQNAIDDMLSSLSFFERHVIRAKWIERTAWNDMPEKCGYSVPYLQVVERVAIEKLGKEYSD